MLKVFEQLPAGFLDTPAQDLYQRLGGPALVHLPGRRSPPLFVSVLLHGNERTGVEALQKLLREHSQAELPRALSVFVGNVEAARYGRRRLDGQPDYNRIWPGTRNAATPEQAMLREVYGHMLARGVFASIDIHNNTGLNPHYACVNVIDNRFFHLATLFSRTVLYFTTPVGVQSAAFARMCPSVTVECGQSDDARSTEHAWQYLNACLRLSELPDYPVAERDLELFHTVATVRIAPETSFSFDDHETDILFDHDLDHLNFRELAPGTRMARTRAGSRVRLQVSNNDGQDVGDQYFSYDHNEIRITRALMPSMLTLDARIVRQDCLCYLMERLSPAEASLLEAVRA